MALFIILVYDMNVKRVAKALKICRKYLHWVQNSVFEGDISEARLKALKMELDQLVNPEEDSVIIYILRTTKYSSREEPSAMCINTGNRKLCKVG